MNIIRQASISDLNIVKEITNTTISEIYPHYYPRGAVEFFLEHHSDENIINDINGDRVFLCSDAEEKIVGTVTIKDDEISRLFVLPQYQGIGYGTEMLNYAEGIISRQYPKIVVDASLPAKKIYMKRGYTCTEFHVISAKGDDYLCYDVMIKQSGRKLEK
ncbi:GNAT family N-acetyltransferase [Clostridiaceae bacterium OttesenSCG-928-D20]|nr:GNAT family N-acetyltransferase [Clostridiaceae bacterium OttesenSCG-928-D20]